jgi:hypothetical protein
MTTEEKTTALKLLQRIDQLTEVQRVADWPEYADCIVNLKNLIRK